MEVTVGLASDSRVARVVAETNKGRVFEAKMYGFFWITRGEVEPGETVPNIIGYDAEGNKLYHYVFPGGRRIQ